MAFADQAHLLHPFETLLADHVPTGLVLAPVLGDVFGPCVKRIVRRGVGQVEDKGLFFILVLVKTFDGIGGEGIGSVIRWVGMGIAASTPPLITSAASKHNALAIKVCGIPVLA